MEAVPHGEEDERGHLADDAIVQELEPLVHIAGGPPVGVDVKRLDEVAELGGRLQATQLYTMNTISRYQAFITLQVSTKTQVP